ncbi:ABC transporter substrate-binding protein [Pseudomonas izuensis]|uniref:ABC transporter substrate-binding protein n=1 Tax=Pseudomonas izuensis TaxID=2684212 RepID=UPI00135A6C26|nr:ABC transporter substrate-binding protein [Pseudomonas izuensis]
MYKKVASALTLASLFVALGVQAEPTLRFGVDPSYPPFEKKMPDGSLSGFDIDLGEAICANLQVKCVWVEQNFDSMIPALKARKFDAILSAFSATPVRRQQVDFTNKIYVAPSALIAKTDSGILPDDDSLNGKSVGVIQGSLQEAYAKSVWAPKGARIQSYQTQDQIFQDLITGRLQASFQAAVQGDIGLLQTPRGAGYAFAGPPITDKSIIGDGVAIGVRKGQDDLVQKINASIVAIRQSGEYDKIASRYFSFNVYGD